MIHHEVHPARAQIMLNLPKQPVGRQQRQRQAPGQYGRRSQEGMQGRRVPETCAADVAEHAARRPTHPNTAPAAIQDIEIFVILDARRGATAAQIAPGNGRATQLFSRPARSLRYKVRGQVFPKTPRATIVCAVRRRTKSRAARILFAEAMNTFVKCYAELGTASSVSAHWRCA